MFLAIISFLSIAFGYFCLFRRDRLWQIWTRDDDTETRTEAWDRQMRNYGIFCVGCGVIGFALVFFG